MNINNSDDPFYRYKRPKFNVQEFKKKIWILNIHDIAKSLARDPKLLEKFLGKCCSTSAKINKQNFLEINAVYSIEQLDVFLQGFIVRYLLCPSCEIPETSLNKKGKMITFDCKACGHENKLEIKSKYDQIVFNSL